MTMMVTLRARSPLAVYGSALHRAGTDAPVPVTAVGPDGTRRTFLPADWCADRLPGDDGLLRRCTGPILDVGCGPGRLTAALTASGHAALGVDISADAVRLTRRRGARALRRDVFTPLPGEGTWDSILLADGNIGIGGDPVGLLRRCRALATPPGRVLVELDPPGWRTWAGPVRITTEDGPASTPFRWAFVSTDHLPRLAHTAGLRIHERWTEAARWFASLAAP